MANHPTNRRILYFLTVCLALQLTGASILFTVYARKISALGEGVAVFGLSATAFSFAALVAAPQMGILADRWGRRPIILACLCAHIFAACGYLWAPTGTIFIGVRALAGALTAGLVPATLSMIADIAPQEERGRWIGVFSGGSAVGFVLGPLLGGWIYDHWGLAAPFLVAVFSSLSAFLIALFLIPETGKRAVQAAHVDPAGVDQPPPRVAFWGAIPRPYSSFVILIIVSFSAVFAWRFTEPQFHFYIYESLGWTSARFGASISGYTILLVMAETLLGRLSDRFGRRPILMIGLLIHVAQYIALLTTPSFVWIALGMACSGLGEGLFMPALNALYLDITPQQYRARMMGLKESVFSLAGLAGPALVVFAANYLLPSGIFIIAGLFIIFSAFLVPMMYTQSHKKR
jgi:DHA1 family multidrug resistance protein-like MFS transporter